MMPLLKRYRMFKFYATSGAGMLALRPLDAWAQNTFANSGNWPAEPAVWFSGALMIAFLWAWVLMIQYRYLRSRLDDSREFVGRNDEYREMLNVSPDGVMISVNDRLLYANPAALKLFGAATFDLLADKRPITLVDSGFLSITQAMRRESLKTRRGTDYSIVRHTQLDGAKIDAEVACAPVNWGGVLCNVVILWDVTGRVRGDRELKESEERHRDLIESAPDAMYVQMEGMIVYMNTACRKLFLVDDSDGYRGRSVLDFVHPDERNSTSRSLAKFFGHETKVELLEQRRLRVDGTDFPASVSIRPMT